MNERTNLLETIKSKIKQMPEFIELSENYKVTQFEVGTECKHLATQWSVGNENIDYSKATIVKLVMMVKLNDPIVSELQDEINTLVEDENVKRYIMNLAALESRIK